MPPKKDTDGEQLILLIREHWVRYVRLIAVYVLLLLCSALFFYMAGLSAYHYSVWSQLSLLCGCMLLLMVHHWFFMATLSQAENHIIVTTDRVIWVRHRIFFDEEMHEYAFEK